LYSPIRSWDSRFFIRRFEGLKMLLRIDCTFPDLRRTFASLKVSSGVSIYKVAKWCRHRVDICEKHHGFLAPSDEEINSGVERKTPAPEVTAPQPPTHMELSWEQLHELVWSKPMTRAA
jgi:hypothetical protein